MLKISIIASLFAKNDEQFSHMHSSTEEFHNIIDHIGIYASLFSQFL